MSIPGFCLISPCLSLLSLCPREEEQDRRGEEDRKIVEREEEKRVEGPLSVSEACKKLETQISSVIKRDKNYVYYEIANCDRTFIANVSLI